MDKKFRIKLIVIFAVFVLSALFFYIAFWGKIKYVDVKPDSWYEEAVYYVVDHNVMDGISRDKFGAWDELTKSEAENLIARLFGYDVNSKLDDESITKQDFLILLGKAYEKKNNIIISDTSSGISADAASYISWARNNGLVGVDSDFKPNDMIYRCEAAVIVLRLIEKLY